ncbi:MAG: hypothetical protein AAF557_10160 [Pseudomonadota bacterium]
MMQLGLAGQPTAHNSLFDIGLLQHASPATAVSSFAPITTAEQPSTSVSSEPGQFAADAPTAVIGLGEKTDDTAFLAFDAATGKLTFKSQDELRSEDLIDYGELISGLRKRSRKTGKHTVYNLTVEDYHTYIAGGYRVHNTSIFVPQGALGAIGNAIGGQLATLFGVDDFAKGLVLNSAGSAVLSYFGDLIDPRVTTVTAAQGLGGAAAHIGGRFVFNLVSAVGGYFGGRLFAELGEALGLGEFGTGLVSSIGSYTGGYLVSLGFDAAFGTSLAGQFNPGTAIGGFIGSYFAYKVLGDNFSPVGAQIGGAIGSLAATFATSAAVSAIVGPVTTVASAFAATGVGIVVAAVLVFLGTVLGGLLGRKPVPWALTEIEFGRRETEEAFYVGGTTSDDGGNTALSQNMAGTAVEALNSIVGAVGGTILATADGAFSLGHRKSQNQVVGNGATYYFNDPTEAVNFGVRGVLNLTSIEGGDIYQKRALAVVTSANSPVDIETTEELREALGAAATFGVREDNQVLTDAVFEELGFSARARYEDALAQAEELGIDGAYGSFNSDTYRRDDPDGGYVRGVTRQLDTVRLTYSGGGGEGGGGSTPVGYVNTTTNEAYDIVHRVEDGQDILDVPDSITHGTIRVWRSGTSLVVEAGGDPSSLVSNVAGGEVRLIIKNWSLERNGVYWEQFDRIRFADGTEFDLSSINGDSGWSGGSTTLTAVNTVLTSGIRSALGISAANNAFADVELGERIASATDENGNVSLNDFRNNGAASQWTLYDIDFQQKGTYANSNNVITADADEDLLTAGGGNDTYRIGLNGGSDVIFDSRLSFTNDTISVTSPYKRGQTTTSTTWVPGGGGGEGGGGGSWRTTTSYSVVNGSTTGTSRQLVSVDEIDAGTTDTVEFTGGIRAEDLVFQMSGDDLVIGIRQADDPWGGLASLENQVTIRDWRDEDNRIERITFAGGSTVLTAEDIVSRYIQDANTEAVFVLDLQADGIETGSPGQTNVLFDIDGDGYLERTAWLTGGDGFLALDRNRDGVINDASELFSAWDGSYTGAFASLSSLDTNNDGQISSLDVGFTDLRVWLDLNSDGTTGIGELNQLHRFGIESIQLGGEINFENTEADSSVIGVQIDGARLVRELSVDQLGLIGNAEGAGYGVTFENSNGGVRIGESGLEFQAGSALIALRSDTEGQGVTETVTTEASYTATNENDQVTVSLSAGQTAIVSGLGGDDQLTGGAGDDVLIGGAGADIMYGGAGDDAISIDADDNLTAQRGGSGSDLLIVEREDAVGSHTSLFSLASIQFERITSGFGDDGIRGGANGTSYELSGGYGDDSLLGANLADSINGDTGDDTLDGAGGNDSVFGGSGADVILGSAGADLNDGGSGIDTVDYSQSGTAAVTVNLETGTGSGGHAAGDTFHSIEKVIGTTSADILTGSRSSETLIGLGGGDTIDGGDGTDTVDYSDSSAAVNVNLTRTVQYGGDANQDHLTNIEDIVGSNANDVLTGDGNNNRIVGGAGNDELRGSNGDDILEGGEGNDSLYGGGNDDTLIGGAGNDRLEGHGGADVYRFGFNTGSDTVTDTGGTTTLVFEDGIAAHSLLMTQSGQDLLISAIGGSTSVRVTSYFANPSRYSVTLQDGTDVPVVLGDVDRWRGNTGNNTRHLGSSTETNDVFIGGQGNDNMRAAGGDDTYVYNRGDGFDTIYDYGSQTQTVTTTTGGGEGSQTTTTTTTITTSGDDTVFLGNDIASEDVRLQRSGNNLIILIMPKGHEGSDPADAEGKITIQSHFQGEAYRVEHIVFGTGDSWHWAREVEDGVIVNDFLANLGTDLAETFEAPTTAETTTVYVGGGGEGQQNTTTYTTFVPSEQPVYRNGRGGDDTIYGANGDDNLIGGDGIDRLYGGNGDDIISGGAASDYAYGGAGNDTYAVAEGDGYLLISDSDGYDRVLFGEGILPEHVGIIREGRHLRVFIDPNGDVTWGGRRESVRLVNVFDANGGFDRTVVEEFVFATGAALTIDQLMSSFGDDRSTVPDDIVWNYGPLTGVDLKAGNDTADLSDQDDIVNGGGGNDTLRGNEGFDDLRGDAGNDRLYGGLDRDRLVGGANNDILEGGRGSDLYVFENGFGRDTIRDKASTIEIVREQQVVVVQGGGEGGGYTTTYTVENEVNTPVQAGLNDVIEFGEGITLDNLAFEYIAADDTMYIGIRGSQAPTTSVKDYTNRIAVQNWSTQVDGDYSNRIETIRFHDGLEVSIGNFGVANIFGNVDANGLLDLGPGVTIHNLSTSGEIASVIDGDGYITPQGNSLRRVYGYNADDLLIGGLGSDYLYGRNGDDTITGGPGRDYLHGAYGDDLLIGSFQTGTPDSFVGSVGQDTYRFLAGQSAYIYEAANNAVSSTQTDVDTIELPDIERWDQLSFTANASHLYIDTHDLEGTKTGDINAYHHIVGLHSNNHDYSVERIEIGDGSSISIDDVVQITGEVTAADAVSAAHRSATVDQLFIADGANQRIYTPGSSTIRDVVFAGGGDDYIWTYGGDDVLVGGAGNDFLRPDAGRDSVYGGDGIDTVDYYANNGEGVTVNLITGLGSGGIADGDVLDGVERVYSTQSNDRLIGDENDNYFIGRRGGDVLIGNGGNDILRGDSNATDTGYEDVLIGGTGNDNLQGNKGADRYLFQAGDGVDVVADYGDTSGSILDTIAFTDLRDLSALTFSDGGGDNLRIHYGDGDQITVVDGQLASSTTRVEQIETADGRTFSFEAVRLLTAGAGWQGGAATGDLIAGGAGANSLRGDGGDDLIFGGSDNDRLMGDAGNDVLVGGLGNDRLAINSGTDLAIGGTGSDTYEVSSSGRALIEDNGQVASGENDRLHILTSGDTVGNVLLELSNGGRDLTVTRSNTTLATVRDYFTESGHVEEIQVGSGAVNDLSRATAALASYMSQFEVERASVSSLIAHADQEGIEAPNLTSSL